MQRPEKWTLCAGNLTLAVHKAATFKRSASFGLWVGGLVKIVIFSSIIATWTYANLKSFGTIDKANCIASFFTASNHDKLAL